MQKNQMRLDFSAIPENEAFARTVISAFVMPLDPTVDELNDVKTAVSEAVTNAVLHGYEGKGGTIRLDAALTGARLSLEITDTGVGIEDVGRAMAPMYTSRPDLERSGMGFWVMQSFMDELEVVSHRGRGTTVRMAKRFTQSDREAV